MLKRFRSFNRWLKTRYGDKPAVVKGGAPPYRETLQEVPYPTHYVTLIWRMAMEGADKTADSLFKHWKAIFILALVVATILGWRRWHESVTATIDIWSIEKQRKAAAMAKEEELARAETAKLEKAQAAASASAQAEKAKLEDAKAKTAASASAQANKANVPDVQSDGGAKQPRAFYVTERYWVCIHKVVNCTFNNQGDQYDHNNVVRCNPAYSTSGAGFGAIRCPEGDIVQSTLILKMKNAPEKLPVTVEDYSKYEIGSWVFLMCHQDDKCETKIVDPPPSEPPSSAAASASSPPPP